MVANHNTSPANVAGTPDPARDSVLEREVQSLNPSQLPDAPGRRTKFYRDLSAEQIRLLEQFSPRELDDWAARGNDLPPQLRKRWEEWNDWREIELELCWTREISDMIAEAIRHGNMVYDSKDGHYLGVRECAKVWGCSPLKIYHVIANGEVYRGRKFFYSKSRECEDDAYAAGYIARSEGFPRHITPYKTKEAVMQYWQGWDDADEENRQTENAARCRARWFAKRSEAKATA